MTAVPWASALMFVAESCWMWLLQTMPHAAQAANARPPGAGDDGVQSEEADQHCPGLQAGSIPADHGWGPVRAQRKGRPHQAVCLLPVLHIRAG